MTLQHTIDEWVLSYTFSNVIPASKLAFENHGWDQNVIGDLDISASSVNSTQSSCEIQNNHDVDAHTSEDHECSKVSLLRQPKFLLTSRLASSINEDTRNMSETAAAAVLPSAIFIPFATRSYSINSFYTRFKFPMGFALLLAVVFPGTLLVKVRHTKYVII